MLSQKGFIDLHIWSCLENLVEQRGILYELLPLFMKSDLVKSEQS